MWYEDKKNRQYIEWHAKQVSAYASTAAQIKPSARKRMLNEITRLSIKPRKPKDPNKHAQPAPMIGSFEKLSRMFGGAPSASNPNSDIPRPR